MRTFRIILHFNVLCEEIYFIFFTDIYSFDTYEYSLKVYK